MSELEKARELLKKFKGEKYIFGPGILDKIGNIAFKLGKTTVIFRGTFPGSDNYVLKIIDSLKRSGTIILATDTGARPNAPREDLLRITEKISKLKYH